jgi:hypothetical protein
MFLGETLLTLCAPINNKRGNKICDTKFNAQYDRISIVVTQIDYVQGDSVGLTSSSYVPGSNFHILPPSQISVCIFLRSNPLKFDQKFTQK